MYITNLLNLISTNALNNVTQYSRSLMQYSVILSYPRAGWHYRHTSQLMLVWLLPAHTTSPACPVDDCGSCKNRSCSAYFLPVGLLQFAALWAARQSTAQAAICAECKQFTANCLHSDHWHVIQWSHQEACEESLPYWCKTALFLTVCYQLLQFGSRKVDAPSVNAFKRHLQSLWQKMGYFMSSLYDDCYWSSHTRWAYLAILCKIYWPPIRECVKFKVVCLFASRCPDRRLSTWPTTCRLVSDSTPRSLRSADVSTCVVLITLSSYGDRTFAAAGPCPWNSLPVQLRNPDIPYGLFRRQLKGHLFREAWTRRSVTSNMRRHRKTLTSLLASQFTNYSNIYLPGFRERVGAAAGSAASAIWSCIRTCTTPGTINPT